MKKAAPCDPHGGTQRCHGLKNSREKAKYPHTRSSYAHSSPGTAPQLEILVSGTCGILRLFATRLYDYVIILFLFLEPARRHCPSVLPCPVPDDNMIAITDNDRINANVEIIPIHLHKHRNCVFAEKQGAKKAEQRLCCAALVVAKCDYLRKCR